MANKTIKFWPAQGYSQNAVAQVDEQQVHRALSPRKIRTAEIDPSKEGKVIFLMFRVSRADFESVNPFSSSTGIRPAPEESVENRREDQVRLIKRWLSLV